MHNLLVTMSGGTTTVINATMAGIVKSAQKSNNIDRVYAGVPGILGALENNLVDITALNNDDLFKLIRTPGSSVIGTTRVKSFSSEELEKFKSVLRNKKIEFFVNIGGNGTVKQTKYLVDKIPELKAVSIPKTVDNDLGDLDFKNMYFTPGFPSVVNYWIHKVLMLNNENLGACSHDKVLVAQTFGRDTGFIAGAVRVADPKRDLPMVILLPEDQRPLDEVLRSIKKLVDEQNRAIVVMAEGYNVGDIGAIKDVSGQISFSSSKNLAAQLLVNACVDNEVYARAFIPGIDQRSEILFTTKFDINHSIAVGEFAVDELDKGNFGFLVGLASDGNAITCHKIPFHSFSDFSRRMPERFIDYGNFDVSDAYLRYLEDIVSDRARLVGSDILSLKSFYGVWN